jgi:hypothetical protein
LVSSIRWSSPVVKETTGFELVEAHFQPTDSGPTPPTPSPRAYRYEAFRASARGEGAKGVRGGFRLLMKLHWLKPVVSVTLDH